MYTRSYNSDDERPALPRGYDGTAFHKEIREAAESAEPKDVPTAASETEEAGLFWRIPLLGSIRAPFNFKLPFDLNSEDLVLIGLALLLFFTKDGDRECALMIALLLFIR